MNPQIQLRTYLIILTLLIIRTDSFSIIDKEVHQLQKYSSKSFNQLLPNVKQINEVESR